MTRIAIIGAGVSGLTAAQMLKDRADVVVFEKETNIGGLIRCERINGSLFHTCGGHVFNTKNEYVLNWFWQNFNKDKEFHKAERNSVIILPNSKHIPYPIENFVYLLDEDTQQSFIQDLLAIATSETKTVDNFQDFLRTRFGNTLYQLYFEPYNKKIWRRSLADVPIDWLLGKLPMPTVAEMIFNNFNRVAEKQFVHSSFFYERQNGSQLIADRLAEGINIRCNTKVEQIEKKGDYYIINDESFDKVIFCGNLKDIPNIIKGVNIDNYIQKIGDLQYHGTTTVFCEIDANPYSWIYLPDEKYMAHRIICTGNFANSNNANDISSNRITATIEFTDYVDYDSIIKNLKVIPLNPSYICHKYNPLTYPIQTEDTRDMIVSLKQLLASHGFYLTGRFADWEYYNMDVAIAASIKTVEQMHHNA